jgi:hypothetical protein
VAEVPGWNYDYGCTLIAGLALADAGGVAMEIIDCFGFSKS